MAANQYGIDLASMYSNVEAIKGQRLQNLMAQQKLDQAEANKQRARQVTQLRTRALTGDKQALNALASIDMGEAQAVENMLFGREDRQIEAQKRAEDELAAKAEAEAKMEEERQKKKRANQASLLRQQITFGDGTGQVAQDARKDLLVLDPEGGKKFIDAIDAMSEKDLEQAERNIEETGRIAHYVLQAETPEEGERRYQLAKKNLPEAMQKKMPPHYNSQWLQLQLARATSMDNIIKDQREAKKAEGKGKDEKPFQPKSADESLIYRQSVELMGGMMDADGNITALDPSVRPKVQAIAREASKIYTEGKGNVTRSEAVSRAAEKFGVTMPVANAMAGNPGDPDNIRNFMKVQ